MEHRLHKLGQYVRCWTAYLRLSQYDRPVRGEPDGKQSEGLFIACERHVALTPEPTWLFRPLRTRTVGGVGAGS